MFQVVYQKISSDDVVDISQAVFREIHNQVWSSAMPTVSLCTVIRELCASGSVKYLSLPVAGSRGAKTGVHYLRFLSIRPY